MFFWRPKERKAPAHGKSSPPFLCSGVAGRHPSVKKVLPLEPFCWFWGDADLPQLVTRQGEHLTSGRTFTSCKFCCTRSACKQASTRSLARISLSLNPKINRVQTVSFNGVGFSLTLPFYAVKFANYATIHCKGNPSLKAKGQRWEAQWAAEQYLEAGDMMFERSEFLSPQALRQAASGEVWSDRKMLQGNSWICKANRQYRQQLVVRSADIVCTARDAERRCCQLLSTECRTRLPRFWYFFKKVQKARLQKEYKITD